MGEAKYRGTKAQRIAVLLDKSAVGKSTPEFLYTYLLKMTALLHMCLLQAGIVDFCNLQLRELKYEGWA
ncbi:hypothetical protein SAMN05216339_101428 [Nitrosomonas eutropha]|uniref:Uncharacterized protein n=1 Tax=Nitrosomonas eutropha TaxID=916 RepID=A0A1I7FDD1_9PROT|nr:hypothetical protein SAMN05216339_101428 [Nitrosomonas eutropha]